MTQSVTFAESAHERLQKFLVKQFGENFGSIKNLTPDASLRDYFRIDWKNETAIACVYPEPFERASHSYLDVTNLFLTANLPVAKIYDFDENLGVIILEDFGNSILRDVLETSDRATMEYLINLAIDLIAKIQGASNKAFELNSIASRLAFDEEKLIWELDFFIKHYFESLRGQTLSNAGATNLKTELTEVARELAARPRVLCHRDFHAANLMLDRAGNLRVIDHQDARLGPASYDLVSLLLDRISQPPSDIWIQEKQNLFLNCRKNLELEKIDLKEFEYEFDLQTIQRCLKAIGTCSYQTAVRKRSGYTQYINPMFQIVLKAAEKLNRFPDLQRIIKTINSN
jgi:aminoglycoside/choline kinase family phosphotransferase